MSCQCFTEYRMIRFINIYENHAKHALSNKGLE